MPKIAFLPVVILWLGVYDVSKITIIVIDAIFPVIAATVIAIQGVERELIWSARNMGASDRELMWQIVLPAALPQIITGLQVALPLSLIVAVVAEMLMGGYGLGGAMMTASRFANSTRRVRRHRRDRRRRLRAGQGHGLVRRRLLDLAPGSERADHGVRRFAPEYGLCAPELPNCGAPGNRVEWPLRRHHNNVVEGKRLSELATPLQGALQESHAGRSRNVLATAWILLLLAILTFLVDLSAAHAAARRAHRHQSGGRRASACRICRSSNFLTVLANPNVAAALLNSLIACGGGTAARGGDRARLLLDRRAHQHARASASSRRPACCRCSCRRWSPASPGSILGSPKTGLHQHHVQMGRHSTGTSTSIRWPA